MSTELNIFWSHLGARFASKSLRTTFCLCLFFLLAFFAVRTCYADGNATNPVTAASKRIAWPLGRAGDKTLALDIPLAYGRPNAVAEAMEAMVYPNGRLNSSKQVHKELLFSALWPDMAPDVAETHKEFGVPGGGRQLTVLLQSGAVEDYGGKHYDALQSWFEIAVKDSMHLCITPPAPYNLDGTPANVKCYERSYPDKKPPKFGLERIGVDFSKYPDFPVDQRNGLYQDDILFSDKVDAERRTVILCMAEEARTVEDGPQYFMVAQCQHRFVFKPLNALVTINYRRVYLKDWRAMQAAWEKLLLSFISETPQGLESLEKSNELK